MIGFVEWMTFLGYWLGYATLLYNLFYRKIGFGWRAVVCILFIPWTLGYIGFVAKTLGP